MTKNWKKFPTEKELNFFGSKTAIYLSQGLHKGRPSYRRSLQPSKENIQRSKTWNFLVVFYFCGSTDLTESRFSPYPNFETLLIFCCCCAGEGSGVARSFYTALAEALLAGQPVPNLEAAQVTSRPPKYRIPDPYTRIPDPGRGHTPPRGGKRICWSGPEKEGGPFIKIFITVVVLWLCTISYWPRKFNKKFPHSLSIETEAASDNLEAGNLEAAQVTSRPLR